MWARALVCLAASVLVPCPPVCRAWIPPSPEAQALQDGITAAIAKGAAEFLFPPGDFYFHDVALNITNANALLLSGASTAAAAAAAAAVPTTLYFGPGFGVHLSNCSNTTLQHLIIDYSPLPYVFASVLNASADSVVVSLSPGSLSFEELVARYPPHDTWPPVSLFGGSSNDLLHVLCPWGSPPPARPLAPNSTTYSLACSGRQAQPGQVVVAATRFGFTVTLSDCARTRLFNITIHAAGNMAITEFQGAGANVYERVRLVPRDAAHPLASNADGFHSSGLRQGPQLLAVEMKNLLDDYFNVHNTFQLLLRREGPRAALLGDYQLFRGDDTVYATQQTLARLQPGEHVSFYPLNTFLYPGLGTAVVQQVTRVTDPALQPLLAQGYAAASARATDTPCSACRPGLNAYASAQLYNVTFTAPLPAAASPPTTLANCDNISNTHALIRNSSFSGSNSNLGRFKSAGGSIVGNVFRNTLHQNLEIESLQNWLEGMLGVHDVVVADNVFYGTAASPVHTFGSVDVLANNTCVPEE